MSHFWYSSQREKRIKSCSPSWGQDPFKSRLDEPHHELGTVEGISLLVMQSSKRASCFVYLVQFWGRNEYCCSHEVSWCSEPHPEKEALQWSTASLTQWAQYALVSKDNKGDKVGYFSIEPNIMLYYSIISTGKWFSCWACRKKNKQQNVKILLKDHFS